MAVGGVGRGGGRGGPKGVGGAKGTGATFKVHGADATGKAESASGLTRAAGSAEANPVSASLSQIAKDLASGAIATKSEATRKAVQTILEKKGLLGKNGKNGKGSKKMVEQIADSLEQDPRLAAALERTWTRAGNK